MEKEDFLEIIEVTGNNAFDVSKTQGMWLYIKELDENISHFDLLLHFRDFGTKKKWVHIVNKPGKRFAYVKVHATPQQLAELERGVVRTVGTNLRPLVVSKAIRRAIYRKPRRLSYEKHLLARSRGNRDSADPDADTGSTSATATATCTTLDKQQSVETDATCSPRPLEERQNDRLDVNDLPEVPLLKVFTYLSDCERIRCERVCRYWRTLLRKVWQSTRSLDYAKLVDCAAVTESTSTIAKQPLDERSDRSLLQLRSVLNRCSPEVLRRFECSSDKAPPLTRDSYTENQPAYCLAFDDAHLALLGNFEQLVELNLTRSSITNRGLCVLSSRCRKLRRVTLTGCSEIGERGMWFLVSKLKHLTFLDISSCDRITGNCFAKLAKNRLQEFVAESCAKLHDTSFAQLCARSGSHLRHVNIRNCVTLTDEALAQLVQHCPNIERLELHVAAPRMTLTGLSQIMRLTKLTWLALSVSPQGGLTNDGLKRICRNCPLRYLNVSLCNSKTDAEATEAVASWRNVLEDLRIESLIVNADNVNVNIVF